MNGPMYRKNFADGAGKIPTLGECTLFNKAKSAGKNMHKYQGNVVKTYVIKTKSKYSRKTDFSEKYEYTQIMGGVSVSVFGLFGASAEATVTTTVKRNKKSLLLYRHQRIHRGVSSLADARVGQNWQTCTDIDKHYYLRDILTGMESYIFVNLYFSSESKRKELEVKIKVKILFFTISKTIRKVKTSFSKDIEIRVTSTTSFPISSQTDITFNSVDKALVLIERLETQMDENREIIQKKTIDALVGNKNAHLTYFFMPCMIQTVSQALPFKPKKNTILFELFERVTEMRSVLQDVDALLGKNQPLAVRIKLTIFKADLNIRLAKVVINTSNINEYSRGGLVEKLRDFYGPNRAPYYYERELQRITK